MAKTLRFRITTPFETRTVRATELRKAMEIADGQVRQARDIAWLRGEVLGDLPNYRVILEVIEVEG